ncbi:MAG: formate dehydrogenase accessory protein FdhE [Thermodesulfovibrionales bacterium]|nr:formate dehydrogenase accessory protein FdhE [Thermodesulfovibrionales bacterium]
MEIEDIVRKKPHLKETLLLYKKVKEFNESVDELLREPLQHSDTSYPPSIINEVFRRFSEIFNIPFESLVPLIEAMRLGQIDLTRLPYNEVSSFLLPYHEDELWMLLFIIGRPFFSGMKRFFVIDDIFWHEGRCPVCSARPTMTSILEDGKRRLHCSFCGTTGFYRRLGCPVCGNFDIKKDNILVVEEEEGYRIEFCDDCGSYIKTVNEERLRDYSVDIADLISLPLDIIAQGRGYRRNSPNPLGMLRMA